MVRIEFPGESAKKSASKGKGLFGYVFSGQAKSEKKGPSR